MHKIYRKTFILQLILLMGAVLTACGGDGSGDGSDGAETGDGVGWDARISEQQAPAVASPPQQHADVPPSALPQAPVSPVIGQPEPRRPWLSAPPPASPPVGWHKASVPAAATVPAPTAPVLRPQIAPLPALAAAPPRAPQAAFTPPLGSEGVPTPRPVRPAAPAMPAMPALAKAVLHSMLVPAAKASQPVQPRQMQTLPTVSIFPARTLMAQEMDRRQGAQYQRTLLLGGMVSGLTGTLELQDNAREDQLLSVTRNGEFLFSKDYTLAPSTQDNRYSISVSRQPEGQHCSVLSGAGKLETHVFDVRVVCSSAQVSTLAGSGEPGRAQGMGREASFHHPYGIAVDGGGAVLVADWGNHQVRRISPAGQVSAHAPAIKHPTALGVDPLGNVYVASPKHGFIRQLIPAGGYLDLYPVSASAMTGHAGGPQYYLHSEGLYRFASGRLSRLTTEGWQSSDRADVALISFSEPEGIAADCQGNVYVSETPKHRILKINAEGEVFTLAGSGLPGMDDQPGAKATFHFPSGLALDAANNLLVADTQNHIVRRITPQGEVATIAGGPHRSGAKDGVGAQARFCRPRGVAVAADGSVYVADTGNHMIRKIIPNP